MSFTNRIPGLSNLISNIKDAIFGENNSKIDLVLDHFFSIRQEKRTKIVFYSCTILISTFILIICLYLWGLYSLQGRLNQAVYNLQELNKIKPSYTEVNKGFLVLSDSLQVTNRYKTIVSTLEETNKEFGVETSTLPDKPPLIELPNSDPLFGQFQKVKIEYKLQNVSLTRILSYVDKIQKMKNHFRITKFEIQEIFGTKLYFDLNLSVEAYVPSQTDGGLKQN